MYLWFFFAVLDWIGKVQHSIKIHSLSIVSVLQPQDTVEPSVWYTVELQMVENRRGSLNLLFRDYKYNEVWKSKARLAKNNNSTTIWRCSRKDKGCLARLTTRAHNQLKLGLHPHNHLPIPSKRNSRKPLIQLPAFVDIKQEPVDN